MAEFPSEVKELDGCPIASISPESNALDVAGPVVSKPGGLLGANTEFHLHSDGCLMKFIDRPGFAPQCLLVDGRGQQYGIARNEAVADMICNGVNYLHLAAVTRAAEEAAKQRGEIESVEGQAPPLIITPNPTNVIQSPCN